RHRWNLEIRDFEISDFQIPSVPLCFCVSVLMPLVWNSRVFTDHVAHVISVASDETVSRYVPLLMASLKTQGIASSVFASKNANALHDSGIPIIFFHVNASVRPGRVNIRVHHDPEPDSQTYDAHIFLFENARIRGGVVSHSAWIPPASDIETIVKLSEPVTE